jgi:GT2 family glycosyltransferase
MTSQIPTASIVIVADGRWDETFRCLRAVQQGAAGIAHEVIVVDDGTQDETRLALPRLHGVTTLRGEAPVGFVRAANAGASVARGRFIAFLHADAEPHPGWLEPLVGMANGDATVAVAASRLVTPDGFVESEGIAFAYAAPYPLTPFMHAAGEPALPASDALEVPAASFAAALVRADLFHAVQGFDEAYGGPAGEIDLCLRLRVTGRRIVVARASCATHHARCPGDLTDADASRLTRGWLGKVPLLDLEPHRERRPQPRPGRPPLSVVVPVRNALGSIAPCLEGLIRNLGPEDELVISDAGSDDGTREFTVLFARERGPSTRLLEGSAAGGLEEALRSGLGEASRPTTMLFHPVAQPPDGFLDALSAFAEGADAPQTVATPTPAGACVLGPTGLLRALSGATPSAFFAADPVVLSRALAAHGSRLGLVEQ